MKNRSIVFLTGMVSFVAGFFLGGKALVEMINNYKIEKERNLSNMLLFHDWIEFLYSGGCVEQYFHRHNYKRILIYGNGYIGQRLYHALEQTDIDVVAIMDKQNVSDVDVEGMLIGVDSDISDIDCVVITPIFYFDEIYNMLRKKTQQPIIAIDALWKIYDN